MSSVQNKNTPHILQLLSYLTDRENFQVLHFVAVLSEQITTATTARTSRANRKI